MADNMLAYLSAICLFLYCVSSQNPNKRELSTSQTALPHPSNPESTGKMPLCEQENILSFI